VARKIRFDLALLVVVIIIIITGIRIAITGRVKFEFWNASGTASRAVRARRVPHVIIVRRGRIVIIVRINGVVRGETVAGKSEAEISARTHRFSGCRRSEVKGVGGDRTGTGPCLGLGLGSDGKNRFETTRFHYFLNTSESFWCGLASSSF